MDSIRNIANQTDAHYTSQTAPAQKNEETVPTPTDSVTSAEPEPEKRGLVLLQIDGLSTKALKHAMKEGHAPNIAKLVEAKGYALNPYNCGIATVTLPVQAALFYGMELPGNDWYDKQTGKFQEGAEFEPQMREELAKRGEKGILEKGVVFSSPLTGGSSDTSFTVSTLKENKEKKGVVKTLWEEAKKDIGLLKKGGYSLLKVMKDTVKEIFADRKMMKNAGVCNTKMDKLAPILMSCNHNVFEAVACVGLIDAINKGVPVMYTDFAAYDEKAHYLGATSKESMDALRSIDGKIGKIVEAAENSKDNYEVLVFSDHGQTPSRLFNDLYGKQPGDYIKDIAQECRQAKDVNAPPLEKDEIVFTDAYSLGNIYFNFTQGHADMSAVEQQYPGMLDRLTDHPGIGLVCAKEGDTFIFKGKNGTVEVAPDKSYTVTGENPMAMYGDDKVIINQITNYLDVRGAGDVVIFGTYDQEKDQVVDFNDKYSLKSLHGGLGGEQVDPFIISDSDVPMESNITEATQLHELHKKYKKYLRG